MNVTGRRPKTWEPDQKLRDAAPSPIRANLLHHFSLFEISLQQIFNFEAPCAHPRVKNTLSISIQFQRISLWYFDQIRQPIQSFWKLHHFSLFQISIQQPYNLKHLAPTHESKILYRFQFNFKESHFDILTKHDNRHGPTLSRESKRAIRLLVEPHGKQEGEQALAHGHD